MTAKPEPSVRLPDEFEVPARFPAQLMARRGGEHFELDIVMRGGGRPIAKHILITPARGQEGITIEQAAKIDLDQVMWSALRNEMLRHAGWFEKYAAVDIDSDDSKALIGRAERAAVKVRRRRITPELLGQVVELYDSKDINAVCDAFSCSERTARRWLALAREAGLR